MVKVAGKPDSSILLQFPDAQAFVNSLAEQLKMAGQVQRDFLPKMLPGPDNIKWAVTFLPAEIVSGDIYDAVRLDEKHIGFYVADVVGHGVAAALLTMFLKQAVVMRQTSGNSYQIFSPRQVLENLNSKMIEQKLTGSQFVTCCYCLLNIETLELTFSRGGHPYPVLIRKGQQPEQLETHGSLVGVFEEARFVQETIRLAQGDKLLLYSDGAEHLMGNYDDKGGFKFHNRFSSITNLQVGRMNEKLNSFIDDKNADAAEIDDITILGLEIT